MITSKARISELESVAEVEPPRSMLSDKPSAELLLLTIRNMLMRLLNVK